MKVTVLTDDYIRSFLNIKDAREWLKRYCFFPDDERDPIQTWAEIYRTDVYNNFEGFAYETWRLENEKMVKMGEKPVVQMRN